MNSTDAQPSSSLNQSHLPQQPQQISSQPGAPIFQAPAQPPLNRVVGSRTINNNPQQQQQSTTVTKKLSSLNNNQQTPLTSSTIGAFGDQNNQIVPGSEQPESVEPTVAQVY